MATKPIDDVPPPDCGNAALAGFNQFIAHRVIHASAIIADACEESNLAFCAASPPPSMQEPQG
jgi:hypothetical protein